MKKIFVVFVVLFAVAASARNITEKDIFKFTWIGDPQLSPDGSQIAFVRVTVDDKGDKYLTSIWSVPSKGGGDPRQITNGPRDTAPRWSPDGKTLAFLRAGEKDGKTQPGQIQLLSMSGGEPHQLTSLPKAVESIAWSPNGKQLAFTATTKPSDFDSAAKKDKKDDEHESDVRVINQAVYRANGAGYSDPTRSTHVWVIDAADDAKPKQLTSGDFDEEGLAWSPDGSRIYFVSTRVNESYYDPRDSDLYAVPAAGGDVIKVSDSKGSVGRISPSPDGKWIAYVGTVAEPIHSYTQSDIFVVPATGGEARNLTEKFDNDVMSAISTGAPGGAGA